MENRAVILVVEDGDAIAGFIAAVLSSSGYAPVRAVLGREALSLAASRCPDLILLDLGLPDIDGAEVLKALRAWTGVPVLVVSARGAGKVLTYDFIMKEVWGPYVDEIQALRVNMANIRRKPETNPAEPRYIVTEVGVGYRMVENP
ncbi:MAG: response regulator transcription factor [Clostridiales bacterium]|nr:response regulator transcription factor [Clostridiales bacterium]